MKWHYYIVVLDNGGLTADRYTIINKRTGDVWGCSENPFHPCGIGQYNHNIADNYWVVAYGYAWRERIKVEAAIREAVRNYLKTCSNVGKPVLKKALPDRVKQYIEQLLKEEVEA